MSIQVHQEGEGSGKTIELRLTGAKSVGLGDSILFHTPVELTLIGKSKGAMLFMMKEIE